MICPHCRKEIDIPKDRMNSIIKLIKKHPLSISEIAIKTKLSRGTINYFLFKLESQGLILRERINNGLTGRPTIIKLKEDLF